MSESLGIPKIYILKPNHQDDSIKKMSSEEMTRSYGIYPDEWNQNYYRKDCWGLSPLTFPCV